MDINGDGGWLKPQRSRTLAELQELISQKRLELQDLENEAAQLIDDTKLEAVVRVRNIMRAHQLSMSDIA